jgi:hypothetical protein
MKIEGNIPNELAVYAGVGTVLQLDSDLALRAAEAEIAR